MVCNRLTRHETGGHLSHIDHDSSLNKHLTPTQGNKQTIKSSSIQGPWWFQEIVAADGYVFAGS